MKKLAYSFAAFCILFFMVLKPSAAVEASRNGLMLWFNTILPTLLPFIILSNFIIRLDAMGYLTFWIAPFLHKFLGISYNGSYAVITGFLCGYPMGAKTAADLTIHNKISKAEGNFLLSFCNNVSPMFIISFIIMESLKQPRLFTPCLVILYVSPVICAFLFSFSFRKSQKKAEIQTKKAVPSSPIRNISFQMIDESIMDGFETITKLGGYIILFAIIAKMTAFLPVGNGTAKYILLGSIEITNGIQLITSSHLPSHLILLLTLCTTSFGGLSSIAQTKSMINDSGLSLKKYIFSKAVNTMITLLLFLIFFF